MSWLADGQTDALTDRNIDGRAEVLTGGDLKTASEEDGADKELCQT